jgi:hypothetical protein
MCRFLVSVLACSTDALRNILYYNRTTECNVRNPCFFTCWCFAKASLVRELQHFGTEFLNPLVWAVEVVSWSKNWPHCINIKLCFPDGAFKLRWINVLSSLGLGNGSPDRAFLISWIPSLYSGARNLVNGLIDAPQFTLMGLLQVPSAVRKTAELARHRVCLNVSDLNGQSENNLVCFMGILLSSYVACCLLSINLQHKRAVKWNCL